MNPTPNPAYVQWVEMVKDGEEKLVHPGNVQNHLKAGWVLRYPPAPVPEPALSLPDLVTLITTPPEPEPEAQASEESLGESEASAEAADLS